MDNPSQIGAALQAAVERNLHTYKELKRLSEAPTELMTWLPDYANYYPKMITRLQALYKDLQAAYEATEYAQNEGILEITLRSRTQTITWPIATGPGLEISDKLMEYFNLAMAEVEDKIMEARERMVRDFGGGTLEEWHMTSMRRLALLLEEMPPVSSAA